MQINYTFYPPQAYFPNGFLQWLGRGGVRVCIALSFQLRAFLSSFTILSTASTRCATAVSLSKSKTKVLVVCMALVAPVVLSPTSY